MHIVRIHITIALKLCRKFSIHSFHRRHKATAKMRSSYSYFIASYSVKRFAFCERTFDVFIHILILCSFNFHFISFRPKIYTFKFVFGAFWKREMECRNMIITIPYNVNAVTFRSMNALRVCIVNYMISYYYLEHSLDMCCDYVAGQKTAEKANFVNKKKMK